jgi:hypothetical protein|tara:strand:- start:4853 stop:5821 length:969 start_codon:yes stop_codon:yes gene_type:complete
MKFILKKYLNKFFGLFNGELITKKDIVQYKSNLQNSINYLIDIETKKNNNKGLSCIIFSKDRAIQLYTLLETYQKFVKNPVDVYIIYNTSSVAHEESYIELSEMINHLPFNISFIKEKNSFRETLLDVLSQIRTKNLFFLTDDDIFIRNVNLDDLSGINPKIETLSFRHNPKISYSYTLNANFKPPKFNRYKANASLNEFKWFDSEHEWSDPWSVNGQIYLTAEIVILSKISNYKYPNSYENALKFYNFLMIDRKGLCYDESIIMNIPMNIVQTEYKNLHGSISAEILLDNWNKGNKLNVDFLESYKLKSTHLYKVIKFKKR